MKWIKMWTSEALRGSTRFELEPDERSVWYDLLLMAGDSRTPGIIQSSGEQPYPMEWIAGTLNISVELLLRTIKKCNTTEVNKIINDNGVLIINNWGKYQSEYARQKPYREEKKKLNKKSVEKLPVDRDKEGDKDRDKDNKHTSLFEFWNNHKIIVHREIKSFVSPMKTALKKYTETEIKEAIENLSIIVNSDEYWWSHKYKLDKFLLQKGVIDQFSTINKPLESYKIRGVGNGKYGSGTGKTGTGTEREEDNLGREEVEQYPWPVDVK